MLKRILMVMPGTINKFLLEISTDVKEFKHKWSSYKQNSMCYSEEFELNPFLLKGPSNIKNYFQYLIVLNPEKEYDFLAKKGKLVMGGLFYVQGKEKEILMKIVFYGKGTICLRVVSKESEFKISEFLIKTLMFLLKKERK